MFVFILLIYKYMLQELEQNQNFLPGTGKLPGIRFPVPVSGLGFPTSWLLVSFLVLININLLG